jgi:hypothetical protein
MRKELRLGILSVTLVTAAGSAQAGQAWKVAPPATNPLSDHPRLWVRAADLPRLRSWATPSNPMYAKALSPKLAEYTRTFDQKFFPGGRAADPFPDPGGPTLVFTRTEDYAAFFAFMSLITTDQKKRDDYAGRARKLLMHAIDRAALGPAPGQPFRDPTFAWKDRARWSGEEWPLTVDWIYPYLSADDKAKIRSVFLRWAAEQVGAYTWIRPAGVQNSPTLTSNRGRLRWAANNYYQAACRNLTLQAIALDAADDPDGKLRAYVNEGIGGCLYQTYDLFERGDGAGGVPIEGAFFYGAESTSFTTMWMLGLQTAGYTDPAKLGAQIRLPTGDYWEKMLQFYPNAIAPAAQVLPSLAYLGPVHWAAQLEQTQDQIVGPGALRQLGPIALIARMNGNAALENRILWFLMNVLPGGQNGLIGHTKDGAVAAALSFLLFAPGATSPPDYRPSLPPQYYSPAQRRLEARTGWKPDASWFGSTCNWKHIDHQSDICNSFHFFRKGEWITKTRTGYSNTGIIDTPDYWNVLGIQNDPADVGGWQQILYDRGGPARGSSGDPSAVVSTKPTYVYVEGDATNLYVLGKARDILHASRATLWVKPDTVVTYDRAVTKTVGRFKRYNLNLPSAPRIAGTTIEANTAKGQLLRLDALLPARPTITVQPWEHDTLLAGPESMRARIRIEPNVAVPTPTDVRFLTVLQVTDGKDPGPATILETKGGGGFHGAKVGSAVVIFSVEPKPASAAGLSYDLPAGVSRSFVTGLVPGSRYNVARAGSKISIGEGAGVAADEAGVLAF